MPTYKTKKSHLLFEEDVRKMFDYLNTLEKKATLASLWILGARPGELRLLKYDDISWENGKLYIQIPTLKLKNSSKVPDQRTHTFDLCPGYPENDYYICIMEYVSTEIKKAKEERYNDEDIGKCLVFPKSERWIEYKINQASETTLGYPITPYHFRHSCLMWKARHGATIGELKHWKGGADIRSLDWYIASVPMIVKAEMTIKNKHIKDEWMLKNKETLTSINHSQTYPNKPAVTPINPEESHSTEVSSEVNPEPQTESQPEPKPDVAIEIKKDEKKEEPASSQESSQSAESKI